MNFRSSISALSLLLASPVLAQDTVQVSTGWNIVGSILSGPAPAILTTDPPGIITTSFFGYTPSLGYQAADSLGKGLGYWVKVSADGIIVFDQDPTYGCGIDTVVYEGTTYGTVAIGNQCWLDRNLNVGVMIPTFFYPANDGTIEKYCYNDDSLNCASLGGLYPWLEAMQYDTAQGTQGICPPGWHIPSKVEFDTLRAAVGNDGNSLKALGQGSGLGAGTNASGFGALLAGLRWGPTTSFAAIDEYAVFLSSSEFSTLDLWILALVWHNQSITDNDEGGVAFKANGLSVRCLRD